MRSCIIIFDFLHTNEVSRFTNKRRSSTMKTINLPGLARADFESVIFLAIALLENISFEFVVWKNSVPCFSINMAFFTNVIDLQAALSACLTARVSRNGILFRLNIAR